MVEVYCISPFDEESTRNIKNSIVLVFDTFRASTTILYALWRGFKYVIPVKDVEEGLVLAKKFGALTAGEKRGRKIRKYHYSNSPYQVLTSKIVTKYLVIRSTNGTRAITWLMRNNYIVVASTVNSKWASKYAYRKAVETRKPIVLVAVGRKNIFGSMETFEDKLGVALTAKYLENMGASLTDSCKWCEKQLSLANLIRKIAYNRTIIKFVKKLPSSYPKDLLLTGLIDVLPIVGVLKNNRETPLIEGIRFSD